MPVLHNLHVSGGGTPKQCILAKTSSWWNTIGLLLGTLPSALAAEAIAEPALQNVCFQRVVCREAGVCYVNMKWHLTYMISHTMQRDKGRPINKQVCGSWRILSR